MTEISKVLQVKRLLRPQEFGKPWSVNSFEENTPFARKGKLAFKAGKKKKMDKIQLKLLLLLPSSYLPAESFKLMDNKSDFYVHIKIRRSRSEEGLC